MGLHFSCLKLCFFRVCDEVNVLVLSREIDQMKIALKFVSAVFLDSSFEAHESNVLVLFKSPLFLRLLASLSYCVMLAVLNSCIDHLMIEFIWVSLASFLTELLNNVFL